MKRVLVTGASGLVGQGMVQHLLNCGWQVIGTARTRAGIECLEKMANLKGMKKELVPYRLDLCDKKETDRMIEVLEEQNLLPAALVNNARSLQNLSTKDANVITKEQFIREYDLGVFAPYNLSLKLALAAGSPLTHIINIGSQYGVTAFNHSLYEGEDEMVPIHYSVAKAALVHLTKELAILLQSRNIRVNCLSLGGISGRAPPDVEKRYQKFSPSKRMLKVHEINGALDFLLSENTHACVGHNLILDGGWTLW